MAKDDDELIRKFRALTWRPPWPIGVVVTPQMHEAFNWLVRHRDKRDTDAYRNVHDWLAEQMGLSPHEPPAEPNAEPPTEPVIGSLAVTEISDAVSAAAAAPAPAPAAAPVTAPTAAEVLKSLRPGTMRDWVLSKMIESPSQIWDRDLAEKLAERCPIGDAAPEEKQKTIQTCLGEFRKLFGTRPQNPKRAPT